MITVPILRETQIAGSCNRLLCRAMAGGSPFDECREFGCRIPFAFCAHGVYPDDVGRGVPDGSAGKVRGFRSPLYANRGGPPLPPFR